MDGGGARRWGIGVIGCGRFGRLLLEALRDMPEARVAAAADPDPARRAAAGALGAEHTYEDPRAVIHDPGVALVAVATPPDTHAAIAREALQAGRHVFLEKPGALNLAEMDEVSALLGPGRPRAGIDFVMRRNPIYIALRRLISLGALGAPEWASLENAAHDEGLSPGHWFWDERRSGGIWVEHGVHFFDLFNWLLGPAGEVLSIELRRPGAGSPPIRDVVAATLVCGPGVPVGLYHGFTRSERFERTTLRLVFKRAYVEVRGWIPMEMRIDALADAGLRSALKELPLSEARAVRRFSGGDRAFRARGEAFDADAEVSMVTRLPRRRLDIYKECIRAGLRDVLESAADPGRPQGVTLADARAALAVALAARASAGSGCVVRL